MAIFRQKRRKTARLHSDIMPEHRFSGDYDLFEGSFEGEFIRFAISDSRIHPSE